MAWFESPTFINVLYLVLVVAFWAVSLAVIMPGTGFYELVAFFLLVVAGWGITVVPVNPWATLPLLGGAFAFGLAMRQKKWEAIWLGLAALLISGGSVFLFRPPHAVAAVHPLVAVFATLLSLGFYWLTVRRAIAAQRARPAIDPSAVVGQVGEARTPVDPTGAVYVGGELWTAWSEQPIASGAQVRVRARDGFTLLVDGIQESSQESSAA